MSGARPAASHASHEWAPPPTLALPSASHEHAAPQLTPHRRSRWLADSPLAVQGTVKVVVKEVAAPEVSELPRSRRPGLREWVEEWRQSASRLQSQELQLPVPSSPRLATQRLAAHKVMSAPHGHTHQSGVGGAGEVNAATLGGSVVTSARRRMGNVSCTGIHEGFKPCGSARVGRVRGTAAPVCVTCLHPRPLAATADPGHNETRMHCP